MQKDDLIEIVNSEEDLKAGVIGPIHRMRAAVRRHCRRSLFEPRPLAGSSFGLPECSEFFKCDRRLRAKSSTKIRHTRQCTSLNGDA